MALPLSQQFQELQIKRVLLEKQRMSVGVAVPRHMLRSMSVEQQMDHLADSVLYQFSTLLAAKTHTETSETESVIAAEHVPLTWWDHVKERFAPQWLLARWPVEYRAISTVLLQKHVMTTTKICPHVEVRDDGRDHFEWLSYSPTQELR